MVVLVVVVVRVLLSLGNATRHSTPPGPPPQIDFERMRKEAEERQGAAGAAARALVARKPFRPRPAPQFQKDDVPLPEGLCYRIRREAQRAGPSPGKRVEQTLREPECELLRRAARGERLAEAGTALEGALNALLDQPDFYDERYFSGVNLPFEAQFLVAQRDEGLEPLQPGDVRLLNRLALEAAYPNQIVPARERGQLNPAGRARWKERARKDLEAARQADGAGR